MYIGFLMFLDLRYRIISYIDTVFLNSGYSFTGLIYRQTRNKHVNEIIKSSSNHRS